MEDTLVLLKPDAVVRGLCGQLLTRFEQRGLEIVALKMLQLSPEQAILHYSEHQGKPFFHDLVTFITSGRLVAMVLRGETAIEIVRSMMGPTQPLNAPPGTIRGDFALAMSSNVIHGSDSTISANREIKIFFADHEIY